MEGKRMGNSAFNREHRLTAEEAQKLLSEKGRQLEGIQHKMRLLYHELEELDDSDDLLKAAAIPARPASRVSGGGRHADNLDVLERYYRQRQERGMEIREQMWRLSEQEEDIRRLWGCFLALQEPYYGIDIRVGRTFFPICPPLADTYICSTKTRTFILYIIHKKYIKYYAHCTNTTHLHYTTCTIIATQI